MQAVSNIARDTEALLDPGPEDRARGAASRPRDQADQDDLRSYHRMGRMLLASAVRDGRLQAAAAAAEVFWHAIESVPDDATLHNGLGAALVERAQLEANVDALATLREALRAFQAASGLAARQSAPGAVRLRYAINTAMVLWMLGGRTEDTTSIAKAVDILQSVSRELPRSSAHWAHVQDNLGNALMALGRIEPAIAAYQAAIDAGHDAVARGRSLNNLATAYAAQGRHADANRTYREALKLQPREQVPLAWARTQHNFANTRLQEALATESADLMEPILRQAIDAFEAAREVRQQTTSPLDWAVTTVNLASAYVSLGAHFCARKPRPDRRTGTGHIRRAIALYTESLPELTPADAARTVQNIAVALRILEKTLDGAQAATEIHQHQTALLALAARHGAPEVVATIRAEVGARQPTAAMARAARATIRPALPAGLHWPTESYTQAHRAHGEDIVAFLSRVWLKLIQAGVVDLRMLRATDPSAAKAIDNFTRRTDPVTGQRRKLPPQLRVPTKKELNDALAARILDPGERPARLDWALRARARRGQRG